MDIEYADTIYNDHEHEVHLAEHAGIHLMPIGKQNMRHQFAHWVCAVQGQVRQRIESSFSLPP